MLYNPKWLPETKPDVFSLESLIAWLEMQPADTKYDWYNINDCLMCRYLQAHGYLDPASRPGLHFDTIKNWGERGYYDIGLTFPWTFGAALARAKCALATRNGTEA